ncbi:MAG: DUF418 domain-containing protein [Sphingomonas sp.]
MTPATANSRLATLDAVRGVAVLGILLLNIIDFAMPSYAYVDPHYYGGATGANWAAWAINYVLFDGKMRGLFTMMFGASTVLIAETALAKGESPARVHYARMASLFGFGMVHAYLIWAGDILVLYAVCGAVAFAAWRWRPPLLLSVGIFLLLFKLVNGVTGYTQLHAIESAAHAPGATAEARKTWTDLQPDLAPPPAAAQADLDAYRGGYTQALAARIPFAWFMQSVAGLQSVPDTIALMLIGMALYRLGFFSGAWSRRTYWWIAIGGYLACVPLYLPLIAWLDATRFSGVTITATDAIHLSVLRPFLSLADASLVILFVRSGTVRWLQSRLIATGRTAFSNYLGTSIVCTLIFNGYGLGLYGHLTRWQCYIVVAGMWLLMLLWSKPWLARFKYGPFEWAWRSLARGRAQPMRGAAA